MENVTDIRLLLHARGFPIIPDRGKRPPMDEWQKTRTNPAEIKLWARVYQDATNTGVLTRHFPVIDIDILNPEASEALEHLVRARFEDHGMISARIGLWPKRAFMFHTDKPFPKQTLKLIAPNGKGEKIEILGDGEQLVIHGIHDGTGKPYSWSSGTPWADIAVADLPLLDEATAIDFLRDAGKLLTTEHGYTLKSAPWLKGGNGENGATASASNWGKLFTDIYTGADLHDSIRDLAMSFVAVGMSGAAAVARLRSVMEESRAKQDRSGDWQDRYDDIPRAVHSAQAKLEIERELDELRQQQKEAIARATREQPQEQEEDPPPPPPPPPSIALPFFRHGEVNPLESRSWCVQDIIPEVGSGLISGQWGSYKTFNALELAHCVMTGRPYLGQEVTRPGGVLFFALEGASEIAVRIQGALDHKGSWRLDLAPFYWVTASPSLLDKKTADVITATAEAVEKEFQERFNFPLALIIIDTIIIGAGFRKDGQENDAAVTHAIMSVLAQISQRAGCFVFGIDHYGKDASVGTRGSSAKESDADVILACLADRNEAGEVSNTRLALRKRRSGPNGEEFPFRTRQVEVGTNKAGKPETTLVLDFGADPNAAPRPAQDQDDWGKSKPAQHLRKVIMALMVNHGEDIHPFPDGKPIRALKLDLVQAEFYRSYAIAGDAGKTKRDTKRIAFNRALNATRDKTTTTREIHGVEWIWLSQAPTENA